MFLFALALKYGFPAPVDLLTRAPYQELTVPFTFLEPYPAVPVFLCRLSLPVEWIAVGQGLLQVGVVPVEIIEKMDGPVFLGVCSRD